METHYLGVILFGFSCCVHLRENCSSYFTYSFLKTPREDSGRISDFSSATELECASRCSAKLNCDEAIFYRDSKKCSLYQTKSEGQSDFQRVDNNTKTRIVRIKKVSKFLNVKKIDFNIVKLGIRNVKFT